MTIDKSALKALAEAATPDARQWLANFFKKVELSDGCWNWTGAKSGRPGRMYGCFWNGKPIKAHRFAQEAWNGPVLPGLVVCHHCDNHGCVNPSHLYAGTASQNVRDAVTRGRHSNGQAEKTKCANGHPYSPGNTYVYRNQRQCRTCRDVSRGRVARVYF